MSEIKNLKNQQVNPEEVLYVRVDGMYCEHCFQTVRAALLALDGVETVSFRQIVAELRGSTLPDTDTLVSVIRDAGYEANPSRVSIDPRRAAGRVRWYEALGIAALLVAVGLGINKLFGYNVFNAIPVIETGMSYGMLFVTGLLTGIHCMTMCGAIGIYASAGRDSARSVRRPLLYNLGRVLSYTLIGGLVGWIGSVFSISSMLRGVIILLAAVCMLLMSLSMLGWIRFRLPQFFRFPLRKRGSSAFVIGLLNGFMPCGPLQAMQLYALSTGSFFSGALAMFLFALGTVPLMLGSGLLLNLTKGKARAIFAKFASVLILLLSLLMLLRGLSAFGIDLTNLGAKDREGYLTAAVEDGVQTVSFDLEYDAYADIIVRKNIPARIVITADKDKITGCNNEVISSDFGFDVVLQPGENVIEFLPTQEGDYLYTCWMNMIRNHIIVVENTRGGNP